MQDVQSNPLHGRRELLMFGLGLPLLLSGCRSSGGTAVHAVKETQKALRKALSQLAEGPEEEERLLAILGDLETASLSYAENHMDFIERINSSLVNRSVTTPQLEEIVAANAADRKQNFERLFSHQDQLKAALGPERWATLTTELESPERVKQAVGRTS
jgi:hypothetical protein